MIRALFILLASVAVALADTRTEHFVTPSGAGSATGADWANAWSLSDLNTVGNWGAGEAKITAGETVYLSGGSSSALYNTTIDVKLGGVTFKPGAAHPTLSSGHDGQVQIFAAGVAIECNTLTNVVWDGRWGGQYTNRFTLPSVSDFKIWARSTNSVGVHWKGSWNQFYSIAAVACGDTEDVDHGFQSNPSSGQETVGTIIDGCFSAMNYGDGFNVNRANTNSATNFVLRSSYIYSNRVDGIQIPGGMTYTNNLVDGTGNQDAAHGDGIQGAMGNIVIAGNTFRNWPQSIFIESGGSDTYFGNIRIFNNEFYRTEDYTTYMLAVSLKAKFTSAGQTVFMENLLIANNTVQNTYDRHGVRIQYAPTPDSGTFIITNGLIVNNIINDIVSSSRAVAIDDAVLVTDGSLTIQTNNVFGNEQFTWDGTDYATIAALVAAHPTFTGNTNAAPIFSNTNSYNLRLDATDVYCIGKAVPVAGVEVDIVGNARSSSTPSIGAWEYVAAATAIVTNNAGSGRVAGFRGLRMEILPLPVSHNHPASPLLFEDFEASGYTTAGWASYLTGTGNSINPDNTTNVLSGSQSFALVGISDDSSYATNSFTASSEVFGYLEFKCLKYPSEDGDAYRQILRLEKEDGTPLFNLMMFNTGVLYIQTGGTSDGATAFGALTLGQTYYIWFSWDKNNGSNSAATMSVSTTKVRPTSGDGFVSITGTTIADDATRLMIGYDNTSNEGNATFNGAPSWIYDYVILDDVEIQSYP